MKLIFKILIYNLAILIVTGVLSSCSDEKLEPGSSLGMNNPEGDPEMVCIPLSLSFDVTVSSREGGTDPRTNFEEFTDGDEHIIDFDMENECYALIFDNNWKARYIQPVYPNTQLGEGSKINGSYTEFTVPVVTYVPKADIHYDEDTGKSDLMYIMVVLNGGKIYNKLKTEFDKLKDDTSAGKKIIGLTWNDENDGEGTIGYNSYGHFTMTNSAYYNSKGELQTATPITGKIYPSVKAYMEDQNRQPSASVYVERMVAKFSQPTFSTDVIGSDKVFRPDQNSLAMFIYSWEGDTYKREQRNWRIHLLGWTINGTETKNFIFKNVPELVNYNINVWWNDVEHFRTYWSVDPHYSSGDDFYPWQTRKAADYSYPISLEFGARNNKTAVLQYKSFNEVYWPDDDLYTAENTFDPNGTWYDSQIKENGSDTYTTNLNYLDGRSSLLAANHLLVTAELYIQGEQDENFNYINEFGKVKDLYGDRVQRYYKEERDWIKMFVKDFNDALEGQERMSFYEYDWDKEGISYSERFIAIPTGSCRLYYDGKLLTNDLIDQIFDRKQNLDEEGHLLTGDPYKANVRGGDGRLIPWLEPGLLGDGGAEGLTVKRLTENDRYEELTYYVDGNSNNTNNNWTPNKYKSLFYEWFGPIDHFKEGKMYYAGEIKHHNGDETTNNINYYGTVRNHWYRFNIESINSPGIPVDDLTQKIIPDKHATKDQISVYTDIIDWHPKETEVDFTQ
ncbi:MAG: Mfa1 fimbrilin C-terminal domain-containing protein [Muribaculaceae bacterium]|nr:Mfa1 fimbrilin C-terminal domain-containing protein [Muribaculaceae bacterium]